MSTSVRRYSTALLGSLAGLAALLVLSIGATLPAPVAPTFDLSVHEGGTSRPDLCLRIALGPEASAECGHLRISHALPTTITRGRPRTPVLTYNSGHASPFVLVPVHITLPAGGDTPTKVSVKLTRTQGGGFLAEGNWTGSAWTAGTTRRVTLGFTPTDPTGIHSFNIEVTNWYNTTPYSATGTGQYVVVNRSASKFGAGWWLAGLEELNTSTMTVVDGGGGVRKYNPAGTGKWAAMNVDRPDTLVLSGSNYIRKLPRQVQVVFNSSGQHIKTITPRGDTTQFTSSAGKLQTIKVPAPTSITYTFTYDGTNDYLISVASPGSRTTTIKRTVAQIDSIRDPGAKPVKFTTTSGRITSRFNRRGIETRFAYDAQTFRVNQVRIDPSSLNLTSTLTAAEGRGFGSGATPVASVPTTDGYTLYDGPRLSGEAIDQTKFWIDRFGSPKQIQDALAGNTTLGRGNALFPALVTSVIHPNSYKDSVVYNTRGNVTHQIRVNPYGTGQNDTTRYTYYSQTGTLADYVQVIVPPEKDSTVFSHATNGNVDWQQDARGSTSRVLFRYYTNNLLLKAVQYPSLGIDSLAYDPTRANLSLHRSPLLTSTTHFTDAIGRDTSVVTPIDTRNDTTRYVYNAMGLLSLTRTWGPATTYSCGNCEGSSSKPVPADYLEVTYTYDDEGNTTNVSRVGGIGSPLATSYTYDNANRKKTETNVGAGAFSYTYDPAGNVTAWTRYGKTVTMQYDALNRLTKRVVPEVFHARALCTTGSERNSPCLTGLHFDSMRIASDEQTFAYDARGAMTAAHNSNARVRRTYFAGGELKTDSIIFRGTPSNPNPCPPICPEFALLGLTGDPYPDAEFIHKYGMSHTYDRNGRPKTLGYPSGLSGTTTSTVNFAYNNFGALLSVDGLMGATDRYTYTYDTSSRITRLAYAGGTNEDFTYDSEDRLKTRVILGKYSDTLTYDKRGRITKAALGNQYVAEQWYSNLGHVVASRWNRATDIGLDEFRYDSHGNVTWSKNRDGLVGYPIHVHTHDGGGRLSTEIYQPTVGATTTTSNSFRDFSNGDATFGTEAHYTVGTFTGLDASRYYYAADGNLRAVQRYARGQNGTNYQRDLWQETRYDALGRRIWQWTLHEPFCSTNCNDALDRFIWNGAQILVELRAPGDGNLDVQYGSGKQAGRTLYVHGPGIDAPLAVYRRDLAPSTTRIIPFRDWRGQAGKGNFSNGWPECGSGNCIFVDWPAPKMRTWLDGTPSPQGDWVGSLIQDQRDASGLLYRRNRYYDPNSGQFTQTDPVGLAGGMNLYGFANGNPITYSDPFGLAPCSVGQGGKPNEEESQADAHCEAPLPECVDEGLALIFAGALDASSYMGVGFGLRAGGQMVRGGATVLGSYLGASAATRAVAPGTMALFSGGRVNAAVAVGMAEMYGGAAGAAAALDARVLQVGVMEGMLTSGDPGGAFRTAVTDLLLPGKATMRSAGRFRACLKAGN